jgi:hypothetical protein
MLPQQWRQGHATEEDVMDAVARYCICRCAQSHYAMNEPYKKCRGQSVKHTTHDLSIIFFAFLSALIVQTVAVKSSAHKHKETA